jgi:peptide/nickel transport system permease protein
MAEIDPTPQIDWEALEEELADELEEFDTQNTRIERARTTTRRIAKHKPAILGAIVLAGIALLAILAPVIAPYDPTAQDLLNTHAPPSADHPLGTDSLGRDILSRVIFGTRVMFQIALASIGFAFVVGSFFGVLAGYFGGRVDSVIQTAIDLTWSFPAILIGLALAAILQPNLWTVLLALGLFYWALFARLVRGEVFSLREEEYIKAADALGMGHARIIFRHVLPNAIVPAFIVATLQMGNAIAVEAALSFLGLGAQPPTPSWGLMLANGRQSLDTAWWIATFPGCAIVVTIFALNSLGDGIRDALDPKLKH